MRSFPLFSRAATRTRLTGGNIPYLFRQKGMISVNGSTLRPGGLSLTASAVEICGFERGAAILDAGCGFGMTGRYLRDVHGLAVTGLDTDSAMLQAAGEKESPKDEGITYCQGRLPALGFAEKSFNGIFCECVLSQLDDKAACLEEFARVLQPAGMLVITDLYVPMCYTGMIRGLTQGANEETCLSGALSMVELIRLIDENGFQIEFMEDYTPLLKQLYGHMIFEPGVTAAQPVLSAAADAFRKGRLKPGYCIIIARRYS